jgi:hypothetical protein
MAGSIDGRRGSAADPHAPPRGGLIPFVTSFSEALRVVPAGDDVPEEGTVFLRSCGRCGALVMCEGDRAGWEDMDSAQRHANWHAEIGR